MFEKIYRELSLPGESITVFCEAYERIAASEEALEVFARARQSLLDDNEIIFTEAVPHIVRLSGVPIYTVNFVLCVSTFEELSLRYEKAGKKKEFFELVGRLPALVESCKATKGVWGIVDCYWQWLFHELVCERIGRLEYEPFYHFVDTPYRGIKKGDRVLLIHIPRANSLDLDEVWDSIKEAYERFKDDFDNQTVPFMTHSWLLYPPFLREVFKKGGNIQRFSELFDIIAENTAGYQNFPNVFGCAYSEEALATAPRETSLQRSMLEFIKRGNLMGEGYGIFLYGKNGRE